jgi:hypothetical protein
VWVCILALFIKNAKRVRCIILPSVWCLAVSYFSTLIHKRHAFQKNVFEQKTCFDVLKTFVCNIPNSKKNFSETSYTHIRLHVKYPLFFSEFIRTWIFAIDFSKILQTTNFIKMRPVGAELLHADGQRKRQKDSSFSKFYKMT